MKRSVLAVTTMMLLPMLAASQSSIEQLRAMGDSLPAFEKAGFVPVVEAAGPAAPKGAVSNAQPGRVPTNNDLGLFQQYFPQITKENFKVLADPDDKYNATAWTVGITDRWEWPGDQVADHDKFYAGFGYVDASKEDGEIALYAQDGAVTSAAKKEKDGWWSSKVGRMHLVLHKLEALEGKDSAYGSVLKYYKKK